MCVVCALRVLCVYFVCVYISMYLCALRGCASYVLRVRSLCACFVCVVCVCGLSGGGKFFSLPLLGS